MPSPAQQNETKRSAADLVARSNDGPATPDESKAFPRALRITRKSEFKAVFERGEKIVGRHFVCYIVRSGGQRSTLGFAVSRKVGKAVVRNRVKRMLREFFRTHHRGFDCAIALVVVARPPSADLDGAACADAMRRMLQRGGILHG